MLKLIVLLLVVKCVLADLTHVTVHVKHEVEDKDYKTLINVDMNTLKTYKFIIVFNTTVKSLKPKELRFPQLIELALNMVKLEKLLPGCFGGLPKLKNLHLVGNKLQKITKGVFNKLPLEILSLKQNKIKIIEPQSLDGMTSLKKLDLSENNIATLTADSLAGLTSIEELDISSNAIRDITEDLFEGMLDLKLLNLDSNKINKITDGTFKNLKNLKILRLIGNDLSCLSTSILNSLHDGFSTFLMLNKMDEACKNNINVFIKKHPGITISL